MKLARALLLVFLPIAPALAQEDAEFPSGSTSQRFAELKYQLVVPRKLDKENGNPLIVVLHGAGGTETGMAGISPRGCRGWARGRQRLPCRMP